MEELLLERKFTVRSSFFFFELIFRFEWEQNVPPFFIIILEKCTTKSLFFLSFKLIILIIKIVSKRDIILFL